MKKIRVQGKLYYKAHQNGWLKSLAYFLFLSALFPHKKFKVKHLPKKKQANSYKHINKLISEGLITKDKDYYTLASKSVLDTLYGNKKGICPIYMDFKKDLDYIHNFLVVVPLLSNFHAQNKERNKKEHFRKISQKLDMGIPVSNREFKCLRKFKKKVSKKKATPQEIYSSLEKTSLLLGVSKPTAIKCRRFLEQNNFCVFEDTKILYKKGSFKEYIFCQRYIPSLKYLKGQMYLDGAKKVSIDLVV